MVEIDPEGDAVGQALPLLHVAADALLALLVERGDAVALDLRLAREAQLLLDLELDGQAVGVPAAPRADDVLPRIVW